MLFVMCKLIVPSGFKCIVYLQHPGGMDVLEEHSGRDSTEVFEDIGHSNDARGMLCQFYMATIHPVSCCKFLSVNCIDGRNYSGAIAQFYRWSIIIFIHFKLLFIIIYF